MDIDGHVICNAISEKLKTANIVIVGCNDSSRGFIERYGEKIRIKCFISNNPGAAQSENVMGKSYDYLSFDEYEYDDNDYYVVAENYLQVDNFFNSIGLSRYDDFVQQIVAEVILSEKRLVIISGNCQIVVLHRYMKEIPEVNREYILCRFGTHNWKNKYSVESLSVLRHLCSVYICQKHEEKDLHYFTEKELPKDCRRIVLPSYVLPLYWPQFKISNKTFHNDMYVLDPNAKSHGSFECGDVNINKMIKEGKTVEEILQIISSDDFYSEEDVNKHIRRIFRILEIEEEGCDISISDYIKEYYKSEMLYKDYSHMQPGLVWEYVMRILKCLGINDVSVDLTTIEKTSEKCKEYVIHCTEIPVYPAVAKRMQLEWTKDAQYDVLFSSGVEKLSFEEYVRRYYEICKVCYKLTTLW